MKKLANKGMLAEIQVKTSKESKTFEMHSFKYSFGMFTLKLLSTIVDISEMYRCPADSKYMPISFLYTDYSSESDYNFYGKDIGTRMPVNDWASITLANHDCLKTKESDESTTITIKKKFRNLTAETKQIKSCQLVAYGRTSGSSSPLVIASDAIDISVGSGEWVEISYVLNFSKNWKENFINSFTQMLTPVNSYNSVNLITTGGVAKTSSCSLSSTIPQYTCNASSYEGVLCGSGDGVITGNENNFRTPIPNANISYTNGVFSNFSQTTPEIKRYLEFKVTATNISTAPIDLKEVGVVGTLSTYKYLLFLDNLKEPVTLQPQESAEITIQIDIL